jgi:hypothetical protein
MVSLGDLEAGILDKRIFRFLFHFLLFFLPLFIFILSVTREAPALLPFYQHTILWLRGFGGA